MKMFDSALSALALGQINSSGTLDSSLCSHPTGASR